MATAILFAQNCAWDAGGRNAGDAGPTQGARIAALHLDVGSRDPYLSHTICFTGP